MSQGETAYWQREAVSTGISPEMAAVFDRAALAGGPVMPGAHAACAEMDGSTDESMDRDILVDAQAIPVSVGCCDGGKCQPKVEPKTMVFQAACEDSAFRQTTHYERLDGLPMRAGLLCEQAAKTIGGPRQEAYGDVQLNWKRIGILWRAWAELKATLPEGHVAPETDVWALNVLQKMARAALTQKHTDSYRDIIGYTDLQAVVAGCDPAK